MKKVAPAGQTPDLGVWPASFWLFVFVVLAGPAVPEGVWAMAVGFSVCLFLVMGMAMPEREREAGESLAPFVMAGVGFFLLMTDWELGAWWSVPIGLLAIWVWHRQRRGDRRGGVGRSARLLQCAVALGVCLLAWAGRSGLRDDLRFVQVSLFQGPAKVLRRPDETALAALPVGSVVQLEGRARCQPVRLPEAVTFDCKTLHWSDEPAQVSDPVPQGWADSLDEGRLLRAAGVARLTPGGVWPAFPKASSLDSLWSTMVLTCAWGPARLEGFAERCEQMRREVAEAIMYATPRRERSTSAPETWDDELRSGALKRDRAVVVISVGQVRQAFAGMRAWIDQRRTVAMASSFTLPERGVELRLGSDEAPTWPRSFRVRVDPAPAAPAKRHPDELMPAAAVARLGAQSLGEDFALPGVITARHTDERGRLTVTVDARRGPADGPLSWRRLLVLAAAVLLLCWQGGELLAASVRPRVSR